MPTCILAGVFLLCLFGLLWKQPTLNLGIKDLVRHAAQMYELSVQDKDVAVSMNHATEALAYLSVTRHLVSDAQIEEATHVKPAELESILLKQQAKCVSKLSPRDPTLISLLSGTASL